MASMTVGTVAEDTKSRLLATAVRLFSEHGVGGTSLQMIADELGVTKAAVYYHFKTKDEITEAVAAPALRELEQVLDEAAAQRSRGAQIDHALAGFVDLIVRHRTLVALFNTDPGVARAIDRSLRGEENFKTRMVTLLAGPEPGLAGVITVHVILAGLALTGGAPDHEDLDDDTLRSHLFEVGRRMLGRPKRRA
ncbi:transcriptional regulator [Saccharomonospora marina XMU15]|uniref:Transcriptional regulator n=2 Tax=Saccharomonospora TaxID=1851 RepID=H5X1I6_9PSEU|nr:transcriptional regulator [Saccharomonospora marina XMU15]